MSITTEQLTPTANNWFSTSIEYEGLGRAEFSDPPGIVEGQAKVKFDEFGQSTIELVLSTGQKLSNLSKCNLLEAIRKIA